MRLNSYLFHVAFVGIFFLPYIGNTQFRVDQIVGALALVVLAVTVSRAPLKGVGRDFVQLWLWSVLILAWAMLVTFASPGPLLTGLKLTNTFSYFAEGTAIFLIFRRKLTDEAEIFFDVLLGFSLIVNFIAIYTWFDNTSDFAKAVVEYYGGAKSAAYGEFGSIGGESLAAQRICSLFPHSQALAVFNLLIYSLSFARISGSPSYWRKGFSFFAMLAALTGGLMTASKTFFLALGLILAMQFGIALYQFIRRSRLSLPVFASAGAFAIGVAFLFQYSRFIQDHVHLFTQGGIFTILGPRFGAQGYLVTSGTLKAMVQPVNFFFGMGRVVDQYSWSDNGFIQVLTFGGIFFFLFFYLYIGKLLQLFWRYHDSHYQQMLLLFYIALVFSNIGTFIFLFPRTALLTTVVVAIVLSLGIKAREETADARHT